MTPSVVVLPSASPKAPTAAAATATETMEGGSRLPSADPPPPSITPSSRALLIDRHFLTLELFARGDICCPITQEAVEREMQFWNELRIWEVAS